MIHNQNEQINLLAYSSAFPFNFTDAKMLPYVRFYAQIAGWIDCSCLAIHGCWI